MRGRVSLWLRECALQFAEEIRGRTRFRVFCCEQRPNAQQGTGNTQETFEHGEKPSPVLLQASCTLQSFFCRLDRCSLSLLKPALNEASPLARYFEGTGDLRRRLFSFLQNLFRTRCAPAARLDLTRNRRRKFPQALLAQYF